MSRLRIAASEQLLLSCSSCKHNQPTSRTMLIWVLMPAKSYEMVKLDMPRWQRPLVKQHRSQCDVCIKTPGWVQF